MTPAKKKQHSVHHISMGEPKIREPEYMVQVNDPTSARRDILESLREVILFMQGYEQFRKIQEEKVATFTHLKDDVRELNQMVDSRLKKYFPKGKLRAITKAEKEEKEEIEFVDEDEKPKVQVVSVAPPRVKPEPVPASELDELESQLRDIESQLQNIK